MSYQPHLIAVPKVGLERDLEPAWLPEDAYPDLEDCYLFRGRIKKRLGFNLLGRLNLQVATMTIGTSTVSFTLLNIPLTHNQNTFTIGSVEFVDNGAGAFLFTTGGAASTINYATGAVTLNLAAPVGADTPVYYYPTLPVMGLRTSEASSINVENLIGFDTSYSYVYNSASSSFIGQSAYKNSGANFVWHGANYQLFWTENYSDAMFTTNNVPGVNGSTITGITQSASAAITVTTGASFVIGDRIFVNQVVGMVEINGLSGTVSNVVGNVVTVNINSSAFTGYGSGGVLFNLTRNVSSGDGVKWLDQDLSGWVNFAPPINGSGTSTNYVQGTLLIVAYKGRLVFLNTQEGTFSGTPNNFAQRARWSQNGTPFYATPVPTNYQGGANAQAWRDDVVGRGGFIDASTLEAIVSCEFVKDTLVVYFERSTWQLRYTGNELLPFVWIKINTELGSESTFSIVPFDQTTIAVGNVGIHACDSVNVIRIDEKIPDEVFAFQNENQGTQRVYGIRDYFNELVYWSVPYIGNEPPPLQGLTFPNKILVYNYRDTSYSYFNDSFTCFGYYQAANDLLWQNALMTWEEASFNWISPQNQARFPSVVGGNQQGFVEILMEDTFNDNSLYIANITLAAPLTTIISNNHNLDVGEFILINAASGTTGLVGNIYKVQTVVDANTFTIETLTAPTGAFTGQGLMAVVNNISILTKRFNPYVSEGTQCRLGYMDILVNTTVHGQITVNLYIDQDDTTPVNTVYNTLNTFPESTYSASPDTNLANVQLWKRIYFQNISQFFQLEFTFSDAEMMNQDIASSDFVLHAMILWFSKSGRMINV